MTETLINNGALFAVNSAIREEYTGQNWSSGEAVGETLAAAQFNQMWYFQTQFNKEVKDAVEATLPNAITAALNQAKTYADGKVSGQSTLTLSGTYTDGQQFSFQVVTK